MTITQRGGGAGIEVIFLPYFLYLNLLLSFLICFSIILLTLVCSSSSSWSMLNLLLGPPAPPPPSEDPDGDPAWEMR